MNKDAVAEMSQPYQVETAQKRVPEGYKQTEVGVIPEDWECKSLGDICGLKSGLSITSKDIDDASGYPCFGGNGLRGYAENYTHDGEFALIGRQGALCGNVQHVTGKFFASEHALVASPARSIESAWLATYLARMNLNQYSESSAQPGLSAEKLKVLKLIVPALKDQKAIAKALFDTDALLSELEKLIAKKQAIKTATMQQLLTGRTRLPQFAQHSDGSKKGYKQSELGEIPEDWEAKNFGDLFEPSITRKKINPSEMVSFVGMQDVSERAQLVNQSQIQYSNIRSGFTYFEKDDVLVAKITPCFENGKGCHAVNLKTDIGFGSTEFHVLRATNLSDSRFIYFWTTRESFRAELETEMVGSAGHRRVPLAALQNYLIPCPSDKQEQTAIATILSDMDAEIQALEQRLNKTRQIKQGMMQELLTGKTRLVVPQD